MHDTELLVYVHSCVTDLKMVFSK